MGYTPWRTLLHKRLSTLHINGDILDIGGSKKSEYASLIKGEHTIKVVNIDEEYGYDYKFDLEKPFPLENSIVDAVLCINVLEHIFNYQHVINESHRILKNGGQIVIAVPFLIQVHPCPHDHWRYTAETLQRILEEGGYSDICIEAIGRGVFTSISNLMFNVLKLSLLRSIAIAVAQGLDAIVSKLLPKSSFNKEHYALGYVVTAKK